MQGIHSVSRRYDSVPTVLMQGLRVLALATRTLPSSQSEFGWEDESDMLFRGFLVFLDPPKASARPAIAKLHDLGVQIKVLPPASQVLLNLKRSGRAHSACKSQFMPTSERNVLSHISPTDHARKTAGADG